MQFNNSDKKNSTITTKVMCAIVFSIFSLAWLYWFQWDVLAIAQFVLSGGETYYNRSAGAVVITVSLLIIQQLAFRMTKLSKRTHALTYLPSMLLLAMLSDIDSDFLHSYTWGKWVWLAPLLLILWGVTVWIARQALPFDTMRVKTGLFSRRVWGNVLQMIGMMLMVAVMANTNAVFHYRAHAETSLVNGDYDEALRVGERSEETDVHLTMLRAYGLSKKGQLGERLFEYVVAGRSTDLLPLRNSRSRVLLLSKDSIFDHLGARPVGVSSVNRYFDLLEKDSLATSAVADYRLCGYLMDRNLDAFVALLPRYYSVDDGLPKHYREALILYAHVRSNPSIVYRNAVMDEDWKNFQEIQQKYVSLTERKSKVAEDYRGSYWYYYYYTKK